MFLPHLADEVETRQANSLPSNLSSTIKSQMNDDISATVYHNGSPRWSEEADRKRTGTGLLVGLN